MMYDDVSGAPTVCQRRHCLPTTNAHWETGQAARTAFIIGSRDHCIPVVQLANALRWMWEAHESKSWPLAGLLSVDSYLVGDAVNSEVFAQSRGQTLRQPAPGAVGTVPGHIAPSPRWHAEGSFASFSWSNPLIRRTRGTRG